MALPRGLLVHPDEMGELWLSRLKGSDIKIVGLHPVGGKKANESLEQLRLEVLAGKFDKSFAALREMGIAVEFEMHAMSWLLPRSVFAQHPDWFRMDREGNRVADFNLCAASEEALAFVGRRGAPRNPRPDSRRIRWRPQSPISHKTQGRLASRVRR